MIKNMRIFVIVLFIILLPKTIYSTSTISTDSTVSITYDQLKKTNLIFAEHNKFKIENQLLNQQIENYKCDVSLLVSNDSIRALQLEQCKQALTDYNKQIEKLAKQNKRKNQTITGLAIGGVTISVGLILLLVLR